MPTSTVVSCHTPLRIVSAWIVSIMRKTASQRLHKNKLAVALANKLARIAWSVLHNEKAFDTQPEAVAI